MDNIKAYKRLAAAILLQAVADLRQGSEVAGISTFMDGGWFESLCFMIDIDPAAARRALARRAPLADSPMGRRKAAG